MTGSLERRRKRLKTRKAPTASAATIAATKTIFNRKATIRSKTIASVIPAVTLRKSASTGFMENLIDLAFPQSIPACVRQVSPARQRGTSAAATKSFVVRVRVTAASSALAVALVLPGGPARAVTVSPQVRHLVYSFTWGTQTSREVMTSGINGGDPKKESGASGNSGVADFNGSIGDQGTIRVDIVSQQTDKGVVIKVSEQAQKTRSTPPATCVIYPTTGVICDPNVTVNPEEMALIRFLAPTFVDPDRLDAAHHWKIEDATAQYSLVSNFTIAKNENGIMMIDENRVIKQQQPEVSTISANTTIGYDFGRFVPTSVNEYTIERSEGSMGEYDTVKTQTVLQLQSDSQPKG